ncbi:TPA: carbohydrate kinase family protein [Candidatus Woesearchaeota archaeon]|nr:carbohydrate kinase family protein [Candidatus Woesearchaeota archaeon]
MASLVSDSNYRLFERILLISRKHHKPVIFAPSITMLHGWMPRIRKLRPSFGMVIVNYEEGCYYTGKTSIMEILRALPGMVNVVMKDVDGAYAAVKGKEAYHVNALPVKVRDATGAGDAFSGAFAYSYYSGRTVQEALKVAAAAAAVKLSHEGAHFPMGSEKFDAFFRKHRHLLAVRRV